MPVRATCLGMRDCNVKGGRDIHVRANVDGRHCQLTFIFRLVRTLGYSAQQGKHHGTRAMTNGARRVPTSQPYTNQQSRLAFCCY